MKFHVGTILAAAAFASAAVSNVAAECGSLGVMSHDNLPEDVNAADVRKCANHPLGHNRPIQESSLAPLDDTKGTSVASVDAPHLQARNCEWNSEYGCSGGYCWKVCASGGKWCWTAENGGTGPWRTCSSYKDCKKSWPCGKGCDKCGCSC